MAVPFYPFHLDLLFACLCCPRPAVMTAVFPPLCLKRGPWLDYYGSSRAWDLADHEPHHSPTVAFKPLPISAAPTVRGLPGAPLSLSAFFCTCCLPGCPSGIGGLLILVVWDLWRQLNFQLLQRLSMGFWFCYLVAFSVFFMRIWFDLKTILSLLPSFQNPSQTISLTMKF